MAMLAEPRQRKRYQLTPRGKALYEDDTRFGTKMLEKMGWTKGKGLGMKEDGNKDFVRQRYKNDAEGLGYEARDDQWTEHEKNFTGLLESLKGEHGDSSNSNDSNSKPRDEASDEETTTAGFGFGFAPPAKEKKEKLKEKFSGESLEEKSKRSKARVHYKKFTRGKDLTLYSEKDLANIFGKKANAAEAETNNIYQSFASIRVETAETTKESDDDAVTKEENAIESGVQIITSTLSVSDYFKQKMAALKNKMANGNAVTADDTNKQEEEECREETANDIENHTESAINDAEKTKKKKSKKPKKEKSEKEVEVVTETVEVEPVTVVEKPAKKKKQKNVVVEVVIEEASAEQTELPKKEKKRKRSTEATANVEIEDNEVPVVEPELKKKKKKKSKSKEEQETSSTPAVSRNIVLEAPEVQSDGDNYNSPEEMIDATSSADFSKLTSAELEAKQKSFNVFTISTFCAEKFRNCDLDRFPGSNISDFIGYSFDNDLTLDIRDIKGDDQRIMRLWSCALNKYDDQLPRNTFQKYTKQVINARRAKAKKMPRFSVKTWKRKNAFQSI